MENAKTTDKPENKLAWRGLSRLPGRVFGVSVISVDVRQPACVVRPARNTGNTCCVFPATFFVNLLWQS